MKAHGMSIVEVPCGAIRIRDSPGVTTAEAIAMLNPTNNAV